MRYLDSITDAGPEDAGQVVLSGSHGGHYPAAVASRAGVRAVIFNDAGIGLERAGVAGVLALDAVGTAAAAVDCMTCRIGDARDLMNRGVLSTVNRTAAALGLAKGMPAADAATALRAAAPPTGQLDPVAEARRSAVLPCGARVALLDSASLVGQQDIGALVITGSHGALIGGDPARALKARAAAAVFNDAGRGIDDIGIGRLPALDTVGVAAVTVAADSARIGDAASALATGQISAANQVAIRAGAAIGTDLAAWLDAFALARPDA